MTAALLLLLVAALTSLTLTPLARTFARARGWMDRPDGGRKQHGAPVPRIGGVAVYGAFLLSSSLLLALEPLGLAPGSALVSAYGPLLVACAAVMGVGLLDDIRGVPPAGKILVQALAALYLYDNGFRIDAISNPFDGATTSLGWAALPLTVLWFVSMSNAFNLIDGLDGLAAGIGLFSTTTLFLAAALNERWEIVMLSAALAGSLLGFLRYNFNPASIFLGDSGALFVGFALAAFAIRGSMKSSAAVAVAAPLLALAVPLVDAAIAVLRRLISGRRVFQADGDHIHHRLVRRGLSPRGAVITLYAVAGLFGALSLLTMTERSQVIGVVVIASSIVTWIGIQQLGYGEFVELQRRLRHGLLEERQSIGNNVYLKDLGARFAAAADAPALRATLVEALERLGFSSFELQGERHVARLLPAWGAAEARPETPTPGSIWRVPLHDGPRLLGLLLLYRPLVQAPFEAELLVGALQARLACRLVALEAEQLGPRPLPEVAARSATAR